MYSTKTFTDIYENVSSFLLDYNGIGIPTTITSQNATTLYYLLYARYGNSPISNLDETQFKYKLFSIIWQYGPTWEKRLSVQDVLRNLTVNDLLDDGKIEDLFTHTGTDAKQITESGTNNTTNTGNQSTTTNNDVETITNHALNPETAPAVDAYTPLTYVNEQTASKTDNDTTQQVYNNSTTNGTTSGTTGIQGSDSDNNSNTKTLTAGKLKGYEKLLELLDTDVTTEFLQRFAICFKQFVGCEHPMLYVTEGDN